MRVGSRIVAFVVLAGALAPVAAVPSPSSWPECRRSREIAPREGAAYSTRATMTPRPGNYLTMVRATLQPGPGETLAWGYTRISKPVRTQTSFSYDVELPNGVKLGLEVRHTDPGGLTEADTGLYLRELAWERPGRDEDGTIPYARWVRAVPATPIKLMGFPVQAGSSFVGVAADVGPDQEVADGVARPAAGIISSDLRVGFAETIEVCHRLAQGWNVHWDIDVDGELPFRMFGQLWIATQWGGWPLRADVIIDRGVGYREESIRAMRLRPGWS